MKLLERIKELKARGDSLVEIKEELREDIATARENTVDLATQHAEGVRAAVLSVAAREFATRGYRQTSVSSIIEQLGINEHLFYRLFPSKFDLLVECFKELTRLRGEPGRTPGHDPALKILHGAMESGWNNLDVELAAAARFEGLEDPHVRHRLVDAWEVVIREVIADIESARDADSPPIPVLPELLAYSIIGAIRNAGSRVSWDDKFSTADLLRANLYLHLALYAALRGETDIGARMAAYDELIEDLASARQAGASE